MTLDEMLAKLGKREHTMRMALELLTHRGGGLIVETGCVRESDNWDGDGMSTLVFERWADDHAGWLDSIDISQENVSLCEGLLPQEPSAVIWNDSSLLWLAAFRDKCRADLLYLDSMDYPYGALCDIYGGKTDLNAAIATLKGMDEREIVDKHYDLLNPSQDHCRAELSAALPMLHSGSLVLIDDAGLPGGGKARLAKKLLAYAGWECLADEYQTLWSKP